jgi:hypothetical protein
METVVLLTVLISPQLREPMLRLVALVGKGDEFR